MVDINSSQGVVTSNIDDFGNAGSLKRSSYQGPHVTKEFLERKRKFANETKEPRLAKKH